MKKRRGKEMTGSPRSWGLELRALLRSGGISAAYSTKREGGGREGLVKSRRLCFRSGKGGKRTREKKRIGRENSGSPSTGTGIFG